jgi:uncharacterized SAM-binding protein YcdF (DUF218 family)
MNELVRPQTILYALLALGLIALWRVRPPVPRRLLLLLTATFVLLSLLCMPVVVYFAVGSLEWSYPPLRERPAADAIVVLSGYVKPPDDLHPEAELGVSTLYRCLRAADVYDQGTPCPVIVSGGHAHGPQRGPTPAQAMRVCLLKRGVAAHDISVEDRSRTTFENAQASAQMLRARGLSRVLLVTDALHLRRSELCFQKQGIHVIPCGCYYRATSVPLRPLDFVPDLAQFATLDLVVHEWLGLAWYWLQGRI